MFRKSCLWAHRTLVVRAMKGLDKAIPVFHAAPGMFESGWEFADGESSTCMSFIHGETSRKRASFFQ